MNKAVSVPRGVSQRLSLDIVVAGSRRFFVSHEKSQQAIRPHLSKRPKKVLEIGRLGMYTYVQTTAIFGKSIAYTQNRQLSSQPSGRFPLRTPTSGTKSRRLSTLHTQPSTSLSPSQNPRDSRKTPVIFGESAAVTFARCTEFGNRRKQREQSQGWIEHHPLCYLCFLLSKSIWLRPTAAPGSTAPSAARNGALAAILRGLSELCGKKSLRVLCPLASWRAIQCLRFAPSPSSKLNNPPPKKA